MHAEQRRARLDLVGWATSDGVAHVLGAIPPQKAIVVSVCLQIYLYVLKYINKLSGTVVGETVVELTLSLA